VHSSRPPPPSVTVPISGSLQRAHTSSPNPGPNATSLVSARGDAPHRELPSFPTRRSSDLVDIGACRLPHATTRVGRQGFDVATRSEEHTSELQSRFELVCRLPLEKKNREFIQVANDLNEAISDSNQTTQCVKLHPATTKPP